MPSLLERINPVLRTAFQGMAGVPIYWEDAPRNYAGPRPIATPPGNGGIQGTLKIKELPIRPGYDELIVREVPVTEERPSGFEFSNAGTQEIIVTLKIWAWSQADQFHPHSFVNRIVSMLDMEDDPNRIALVNANIVPINVLSTNVLDVPEDKRMVPTAFVDVRFRVAPEEIARTGYVIETVGITANFKGAARPQIHEITPVSKVTDWTPDQVKLTAWWEGTDPLLDGSIWRDRVSGYDLIPRGSGAGDVTQGRDYVLSGDTSYLSTDIALFTPRNKPIYVWAYMAHRSLTDTRAVFLNLLEESGDFWGIYAQTVVGDLRCRMETPSGQLSAYQGTDVLDRKVCVGAWITSSTFRMDVDGVRGPTHAHTASRPRSPLQVGAWGSSGQSLSECEIYTVGIAEDKDIRSEIFGFVRTKYKGD